MNSDDYEAVIVVDREGNEIRRWSAGRPRRDFNQALKWVRQMYGDHWEIGSTIEDFVIDTGINLLMDDVPPIPELESMSDLFKNTQMDGLPAEEQAKRAISHTLNRIREDETIGWYMGLGTQAFDLLTEAAATLHGRPVEKVREIYRPINPKNPFAEPEPEEEK